MNRNTRVVCVSLPSKMAQKADKLAVKEDRTMSELIREALRSYFYEKECRRIGEANRKTTFDGLKKLWEKMENENPIEIEKDIKEAVKSIRKR